MFYIARAKIKTCYDYNPFIGCVFRAQIRSPKIWFSKGEIFGAFPRVIEIFPQQPSSLIIWADPTSNGLTYFSYVLSYVICSCAPVFGLYRIAWPPNNFFQFLKFFHSMTNLLKSLTLSGQFFGPSRGATCENNRKILLVTSSQFGLRK